MADLDLGDLMFGLRDDSERGSINITDVNGQITAVSITKREAREIARALLEWAGEEASNG